MALKINPDPTFEAELGISVPGKKVPVPVTITFKYKNSKEYLDYMEENKEKQVSEILEDLVTGWKGFDEEYSIDALRSVFKNYPATPNDMFELYTNELFLSKIKN